MNTYLLYIIYSRLVNKYRRLCGIFLRFSEIFLSSSALFNQFPNNFFSAKICIAHSTRFFIISQVTSYGSLISPLKL